MGKILRFIPAVLIIALVYWQWARVVSWATAIWAIVVSWALGVWAGLVSWAGSVVNSTLGLFGWGLVFILLAIGALAIWLRRGKRSSFLYHGNRWLGAIAFVLAIWGILGFLNLGGSIGLGIIGNTFRTAILRIAGLIIIGIVLVAPRACFHLVAKLFSWLGRRLKRQPASTSAQQERLPLPPVTVTPAQREIEPRRETPPPFSWLGKQFKRQPAPISGRQENPPLPSVTLPSEPPKKEPEWRVVTPTPLAVQPELKQVAQEVWKKYGESADLVTVDGWRLPPIEILDKSAEVQFSQADNAQRAKLVEEALNSYGVEAKVVQINAGPSVTQFGVEPGWDRKFKEVRERDRDGNIKVNLEEVSKTRVKVDRISSLANDLALALAAPSIRIEAPVPGKSVVGVEVPNATLGSVGLRGVIESSAFQKILARSTLAVALGKGAGGEAAAADLTKMPHLLVAGATGSGKTVCLNSIISCLLLHNTPNDVRFVLIDPKRVELTPYNSLPHLAAPVITDTRQALDALRWLNQEMDQRYQKLAMGRARDIEGYNRNKQGEEKMPYLILIIDELADLMMTGFDEVEHILCRLAQLARAIGIHLVVATQRPSVDVVTGLIKANFPTRIAFAVTSQVDSRTILDTGGAEKLLGRGDMLYMPTEAARPKRLQGCLVSDPEIERLVYFWNNQHKAETASLKLEQLTPSATTPRGSPPEDSLLEAARQLAEEHPHISASYLQRKLRIGYPRAARIMEQLEEEGAKGEEG